MIDLYAAGTSNGMRARIALEECGLKYHWHPIDLAKGEHKSAQFLALNPNGQIPVIVDDEAPGGRKLTLTQSSAIMMYCAEKAGKFIPSDPTKRAAMLEAYMSASTDITP
ncbi:MAG TPA: glutathione S-transferase N-terminal domain-containing protein, partial [Burkholderiales bacterium]|nr:glutathione S-transferase N-terminal domain-containing protein [Burkholderiales bacterium]